MSATSRRTLSGEVTQRMLVPVDRHHGEAAGDEDRRRRATNRTASPGHDRHLLRSWRHPTQERGGDVLAEPLHVAAHHEFLLLVLPAE